MVEDKDLFVIDQSDKVMHTHGSLHDSGDSSSAKISIPAVGADYEPDELEFGSENHVRYGETDDLPRQLMKLVSSSTILAPGLPKLGSMIYAGGPVFGKLIYEGGVEQLQTDFNDDAFKAIRKFFRASQVELGLQKHAYNHAYFGDSFHHIVMKKGKPEIAAWYPIDNRKFRWRVPNENGEICEAYISNLFGDGKESVDYKKCLKLPVIDAMDFERVDKAKKLKGKSFIYRIHNPLPMGDDYYGRPIYISSILSGWHDYSLRIPKFKRFLMENQMTIKYIVYVDVRYWNNVYPEWDSMKPEEKRKLKQKELEGFLKNMKGEQNAGNALMFTQIPDAKGNPVKLWEVKDLSETLRDLGKIYTDDSAEASWHVTNSTGLNSAITGAGPGKDFASGGGSGSNIRTAANLQVSLLRNVQDLLFKPLELYRDVNGIDEDIVFRARNYIQTTLDQGSSQQEAK